MDVDRNEGNEEIVNDASWLEELNSTDSPLWPVHVDDDVEPDTYACAVCSGQNWVDTPTDWHCDDCGARHNVPLDERE